MKKIIRIFILLLVLISAVSCGNIEETPSDGGGEIDNPIVNPGGNQGTTPDNPVVSNKVEFKVSLIYNKEIFIPKSTENIQVVWADDYMQYTSTIGNDGYAKIELDGDFHVFLNTIPEGYSYNPNIYNADNDNPVVEIELYRLARISKGQGTELYKEYQMASTGVYRTTIKKALQKVYYEFRPTKAGYYVLETMVNVYEDTVNPKVDIYQGTFAWKPTTPSQSGLDSGGYALSNGFTKNVKWVVKLTEEMLGNVYTFVIYADSKTGIYPINVDFKVSYEGEHYVDDVVSKLMVAEEIHDYHYCAECFNVILEKVIPTKCPICGSSKINNAYAPIYTTTNYTFINSDGGVGSYYNSITNGSGLLVGSGFKYNEATGFWHVYDNQKEEFGPILCAKITQPCAYYEESLNLIESHGNKNLTVSKGTENYKVFIEQSYAAVCNSDGVCFVTNELKEFLQKFSVSQRLFFDGNGFVESTGVYAAEEDQWLFACGYYVKK